MDLKGLSKDLSLDINQNIEWLNREISFVINGSHDSQGLNSDIIELYDITKTNRGKRNNNLIARIGQYFIIQYFGVDFNQALKIYNYLSNEDKLIYRDIVVENLDYYIENINFSSISLEQTDISSLDDIADVNLDELMDELSILTEQMSEDFFK